MINNIYETMKTVIFKGENTESKNKEIPSPEI